ncbi:hypothetical protein DIPPA_63411, partial [Diplonema papillatum]
MGDVVSTVVTPFTAIGAVVSGNSDTKIHYDCPRCNRRVWVYAAAAAFAGSKCGDCRSRKGPLDLGLVGDALDVATVPVTAAAAVLTGNAAEKIWYDCPRCGCRAWVSAMAPVLAGKVCLKCAGAVERTFLAVHPAGDRIMHVTEVEKVRAQPSGETVYEQRHGQPDRDASSSFDLTDPIKTFKIRSCRILHGSISGLANVVAKAVGTDEVMHWWVFIETKQGRYYQLQFLNSSVIDLRKCVSTSQCDQNGLAAVPKQPDADVFNLFSHSFESDRHTIGDVVSWMKAGSFSAEYALLRHNCQDLCRAFFREFGEGTPTLPFEVQHTELLDDHPGRAITLTTFPQSHTYYPHTSLTASMVN